jgi:hypothetical protein
MRAICARICADALPRAALPRRSAHPRRDRAAPATRAPVPTGDRRNRREPGLSLVTGPADPVTGVDGHRSGGKVFRGRGALISYRFGGENRPKPGLSLVTGLAVSFASSPWNPAAYGPRSLETSIVWSGTSAVTGLEWSPVR